MYQTIGEAVKVSGIFENSCFTPQEFIWNNQSHQIEEITSIHETRNGSIKKRRYSAVSAGNLYLLEYILQEETWILEQIWVEG